MATFRPGQVIRFSYQHFWPKDANSRDDQKEILVLHTRWRNKVHGIDMKVLSAGQLEILRAVMDPRNNRGAITDIETGVGEDFREIQSSQRQSGLQMLVQELEGLEQNFRRKRAMSAAMGFPPSIQMAQDYERQRTELRRRIDSWSESDAAPEPQERVATKPIPPMAREILSRMKPGRLVNNPRVFYNLFVKPFLGGVDAYRTFFPGRMAAVQVDPRWNWVSGGTAQQAAPQPQAPSPPAAPAPPKFAGAPGARPGSYGTQGPSQPAAPRISGLSSLPAGAAEGGVLGRPAGVRVNRRGIQVPTVIKPPRNR